MLKYITAFIVLSTALFAPEGMTARSLTPPQEPKNDSYYICYEKRFVNNITIALTPNYRSFKYIGCIISHVPCHLYCGDKFHARPARLKQFQWMKTYPDALNSFYRCAYS